MVNVYLKGHDNYSGIADILRLFGSPVREDRENGLVSCSMDTDIELISEIDKHGYTYAYIKGEIPRRTELPPVVPKRSVKRDLYILMCKITGTSFPWGCLTGIRPTLVAAEEGDPASLTQKYLVREDKAALAWQTSVEESRILNTHGEESLNIYIGIPFCPSRCEYCSFISNDAVKHMKLLRPYAEAVIKEISMVAPYIRRPVASVYLGGGTPTVFDDGTFGYLIGNISSLLHIGGDTEFTVEAGRPDTINAQKLKSMKAAGATRICINPQTMNSETLGKLGRKHTSEDTVRAYEEARAAGFDTVNMDLIAGLKYEDDTDFTESLEKILKLDPEDITIHTLYKKRRALMGRGDVLSRERGDTDRAVSDGYRMLYAHGYHPYYLYRQKDTGHGLENTGFTSGEGCYYNVAMMSDRRDVLSFGAGGMSKRIFEEGRLERCPCIKDVTGYIASCEEMAGRKIGFFDL